MMVKRKESHATTKEIVTGMAFLRSLYTPKKKEATA